MEDKSLFTRIKEDAFQIITRPVAFYRRMAKTGGLSEPILFVIAIALIMGLILAVFSTFRVGVGGGIPLGLGYIIMIPLIATISSFVGAAVLSLIWKMMGSQETFETAYRCAAYATGVSPILGVLGFIPYVGSLVGVIWWTYLMVIAGIVVHNLRPKTVYTVFGILGTLFLFVNLSNEIATRRMASKFNDFSEQVEGVDKMTPEEAGKAFSEFLQGLENSATQPK